MIMTESTDVGRIEGMTEAPMEGEAREALEKPWTVKGAAFIMYAMVGISLIAVFGGLPGGLVLAPVFAVLGHGLSRLRGWSRSWTISVVTGLFILNLAMFFATNFTRPETLLDLAVYGVVLTLLLSASAREARWVGKAES